MYTLSREQIVCATLAEVWDFLKNPANLNLITPSDLHFRIVSEIPDEMYNGLIIEYRITIPFFGTNQWITEIKHIREYAFVDEQRIGPYSFWYHYHELAADNGGTKIIDRVHYEVPYGLAGKVMHALFIRKTLERIFLFRKEKLDEILNR